MCVCIYTIPYSPLKISVRGAESKMCIGDYRLQKLMPGMLVHYFNSST